MAETSRHDAWQAGDSYVVRMDAGAAKSHQTIRTAELTLAREGGNPQGRDTDWSKLVNIVETCPIMIFTFAPNIVD